MRSLMHFLKREIRHKIINVTDQVLFEHEGEEFTQPSNLESYYERNRRYVDENDDEFLDTGLYTQEQITFVRYIINWLVQYSTLARQEMTYDKFSGSLDVTELLEDKIHSIPAHYRNCDRQYQCQCNAAGSKVNSDCSLSGLNPLKYRLPETSTSVLKSSVDAL